VSLITRSRAIDGPSLVAVSRYVTGWPRTIGLGATSVLTIWVSATSWTFTGSLTSLLVESDSAVGVLACPAAVYVPAGVSGGTLT
jgi:hypothetical protein